MTPDNKTENSTTVINRPRYETKWIIVILSLLTLLAGVVYDVVTDYKAAYDNEQDRLLTQAKVIGVNLESQIDSVASVLYSLADNKKTTNMNKRLAELKSAMPGIRTLMILDRNGIVTASNRQELVMTDFSERDYFKIPKSEHDPGKLYVSPPFKSLLEKYVINLSVINKDQNGQFAGVVSATLDPDYFNVLLKSVQYTDSMLSSITHGDGLLFMMVPQGKRTPGTNLAVADSFFSRHINSGNKENVFTGDSYIAGKQRMAAMLTFNPSRLRLSKPLIIAVSRNMDALTAELRREALLKFASVFMLGVFLISGTVFLQRRRQKMDQQEQQLLSEQVAARLETIRALEWQQTFNAVSDSICIIDNDCRILRCNQATFSLVGLSEKEVIGKNCWEVFHGTDTPHPDCPLVVSKNTHKGAVREIEADGTYLEVSVDPITDSNKEVTGYVHIVRDISVRKQQQIELERLFEMLIKNEALLRSVMDSLQSSIAVVDDSGVIIRVNQAWSDFARENGGSVSLQQGIGLNYFDTCQQACEEEPEINKIFAGINSVRNRESSFFSTEYPCHSPDTQRWFLMHVTPLDGSSGGIVLVHLNITDRKLAEDALIESEYSYRTLADSGQALIWKARPDKLCDYFNKIWLDFTGRTYEQEFGNGWTEGVHPDDLQRCVDIYVNAFDKREAFSMDYRLRRNDGVYRWIQDDGCPRYDLKGNFAGYIGYCLEITDRKLAEEALQNKNTEIEQFTYSVSHDLRSPLITFKTYLGYLQEDMLNSDQERISQDLKFIGSATAKMETLLNELLELSRIGRHVNPYVRVSYKELVDEAISTVAGQISGLNIQIDAADSNIVLYGDRPRLAQIWQNVIENAIKYMGNQEKPQIEVYAEQVGKEIQFCIRDNGIGIASEHRSKLFDMFEKVDQQSSGAGLGLAIVKRIVEIYHGRIWVESDGVGHGSCFRFTLPDATQGK